MFRRLRELVAGVIEVVVRDFLVEVAKILVERDAYVEKAYEQAYRMIAQEKEANRIQIASLQSQHQAEIKALSGHDKESEHMVQMLLACRSSMPVEQECEIKLASLGAACHRDDVWEEAQRQREQL